MRVPNPALILSGRRQSALEGLTGQSCPAELPEAAPADAGRGAPPHRFSLWVKHSVSR